MTPCYTSSKMGQVEIGLMSVGSDLVRANFLLNIVKGEIIPETPTENYMDA